MCIGSSEAAPSHGSHNRETTNPNARKNDVNQPEIQGHGRVKELTKVYSVSFKLNKNTWGVKKCETNQKQHYKQAGEKRWSSDKANHTCENMLSHKNVIEGRKPFITPLQKTGQNYLHDLWGNDYGYN